MSRALNVGLYLQSDGDGLGGSEFWLCCLAAAYSARHRVTLLHHKPNVSLGCLSHFSGLDLTRVVHEERLPGDSGAWMNHGGVAAPATARSAAFDVFVTITHRIPPANHAAIGALIVLFPLELGSTAWPWTERMHVLNLRAVARRLYYAREWYRRFASYRVQTSLSAFAQEWVQRCWGVRTKILYPPNDVGFATGPKENRVLSIGRFAATGLSKAQRELVVAFRDGIGCETRDWSYASVGCISTQAVDREYFEQVRREAEGSRIHVECNLSRSRLKDIVAGTRIFWHAAGLHADERERPQDCEHFGHVTVEAMSAGAVPVVIGRGGQKEIVRHGIDGFLCQSVEDMLARTRQLIDNPELLQTMGREARTRAQLFSMERSVQGLARLIHAASGFEL